MRAIITTLLILFVYSFQAQDFQGKAVYKTSRKSNMNFGGPGNGMTDEMKEQVKQRMAKLHQKTYILDFTKSESIYKQDVGLEAPKKPQTGGVFAISIGGGGSNAILYKNIKENRVADKTNIQGKAFLVKDKLVKYDWVMTGETKNIGNYTCYKATYEKEVKKMRAFIIKRRDDKKTKKDDKETEETEKVVVTAWYTPDVPISNGPGNYGGLPGLILEVNDGTQTIVCTEIVLNPSKKIEINEPKKGKVVSRKKFGEISREKAKEMMEKMKGRDGININGMQFKVGG